MNVRDFFAQNASLHLALVAGAVISGGCAPQVFRPRAYIPPPVSEPPQYRQYPAQVRKAPALPKFNKPQPVITPIEPTAPAVDNALPPLPPIRINEVKYTVQKGDSFWKIGRKYGLSMGEIAAYNNIPLKKHLSVGQVLLLPPGAKFIPTDKRPVIKTDNIKDLQTILKENETKRNPIKQARPEDGKHVVMKGDSLWKIANRYNLKTSTLANANNLSTKAMLNIGDVLVIPGGAKKIKEEAAELETVIGATLESMPTKKVELDPIPTIKDEGIDINSDLGLEPIESEPISQDLEIEKIDFDKEESTESLFDDLPFDENVDSIIADEPIDGLDSIINDDSLILSDQTETISVSENITLQAFAVRYGVQVNALKKLNKSLPADGQLKKGMKVTIPLL